MKTGVIEGMVHPVQMGKRTRMSFARIEEALAVPDLIEVQKNSYRSFLKDGLREALADASPIEDYSKTMYLEFVDYSLDEEPKYTVEKCKEAEAIIAAHPELTFMLGFMRRYDHSYQVAKKKMENGDIGDVILVRCYSQDPISIIEGTLEYAPRSGGQFIDMSIHDFDLIRWLTGSEVKELWATGGCYEFKQYKDWDDGDNVSGLMKMENDAMAFFFAGRAAAHGSHVETEIVGTRGPLRIASVPTDSLVEVMSQHGVCRECYQDFITRWHDAYITEIEEFCDCVATGRKATPGVIDGTQSTKIAFRCKESFLTDKKLTLE